ncbi:hypothetical protein [Lunatimonas lonarensis]|uniref:hypothetical protein n=1 Tax=Lunatimonas lonarensis TaxID=1232681 RepID=UPI000561A54B|nr:hypothetical protein [Lunatimonas lonarensis]
MVNFNKCILLSILLFFIGNCFKNNKNEIPCQNFNLCRYTPLIEYFPHNQLENKALVKIREYLINLELDERFFYVGEIQYADELNNLYQYANYTILIELLHLKTVTYIDSVRSINKTLDEEVDEEFIEIYVPTTGNISGMDRVFYYYAKTDTLDVILIQ